MQPLLFNVTCACPSQYRGAGRCLQQQLRPPPGSTVDDHATPGSSRGPAYPSSGAERGDQKKKKSCPVPPPKGLPRAEGLVDRQTDMECQKAVEAKSRAQHSVVPYPLAAHAPERARAHRTLKPHRLTQPRALRYISAPPGPPCARPSRQPCASSQRYRGLRPPTASLSHAGTMQAGKIEGGN